MVNSGRPNSGRSQFFVNVANNSTPWIGSAPAHHNVFGKVVNGYDVAVAISKVPTRSHRPITPIKMNSIEIRLPKLEEEVITLPEADKDDKDSGRVAKSIRRACHERWRVPSDRGGHRAGER